MKRRRKALSKLARVLKEQGRKQTWLAEQTGYSVSTIGAAARNERPASDSFYILASKVLGEDVTP